MSCVNPGALPLLTDAALGLLQEHQQKTLLLLLAAASPVGHHLVAVHGSLIDCHFQNICISPIEPYPVFNFCVGSHVTFEATIDDIRRHPETCISPLADV